MNYQGHNHNSIDEELLSYFKENSDQLLDRKHINYVFGKEMHDHLVTLERNERILRSKILVRDKPVTHWKLNGKYDTKPVLQRQKSYNYHGSKSDNLYIEISKGNEFDRSVSVIKPKLNDNDWERGKYSSNQKSIELRKEKLMDKIESDSSTYDLKSTIFANKSQYSAEIKRERKLIDTIESDSVYHKSLKLYPYSQEFRREEIVMDKIESDSFGRKSFKSYPNPQESRREEIEMDKIESDSFARRSFKSYPNPQESRREEIVMDKIESDSFGRRSFKSYPNPQESRREEIVMDKIESYSPRYDRKFVKIPSSKLNPNSPEFKPQSSSISNDQEIEIESGSPSSEMLNNFSLEFITALTKNPVCVLHEFCQQRGMVCEFKIVEMQGPSHKPRISIAVFLNGKMYDTVVTSNKKEGKRKAADLAIRKLISEGYFASKLNKSKKLDNGDKIMKDREYSKRTIEKFDNSSAMYNHMVSLVYNKLAEVMNGLSPNEGLSLAGRKVVSAIIMQNEKYNTYEVVSLATGNRCITGDKLSLQGSIINDSHAEIIARRSFLYFLYKQLNAYLLGISKPMNLFEEMWSNQNSMNPKKCFKVKDDFKFHLYISTAPCGDGALFCSKETISKTDETNVILSNDHEPIFETHSQGLLRTKIEGGEGTIPVPVSTDCCYIQTLDGILHGERLRTMSCSDKIARWNYLGIQGALLENILQPIFLKSILLGNLFNAGHLSRAVCCRLEKFQLSPLSGLCKVNHPDLVNVYIGELHREIDKSNELSINWCYGENTELVDGVTGELSMKKQFNSTKSRLCKASLFHEFHKIYKMINYQLCISNLTYSEVKSLSRSYDDKKKALYLKFYCSKYGSWVCKPIEQSQFKNILNI